MITFRVTATLILPVLATELGRGNSLSSYYYRKLVLVLLGGGLIVVIVAREFHPLATQWSQFQVNASRLPHEYKVRDLEL
jgi:hypothetical protein